MPRVRRYTGVRYAQKTVRHHSGDLQAITLLRFHIRDEALDGGMRRLLLIETEDGRLYLSGHKKESPAGLADRFLEFGTNVCNRCPASRERLAFEQKRGWQPSAVFNQNGSRLVCFCHGRNPRLFASRNSS